MPPATGNEAGIVTFPVWCEKRPRSRELLDDPSLAHRTTIAIGYWREYAAETAAAALQARIRTEARVLRDDRLVAVPVEDIVPGDVIVLSAGSLVPADGRLLEATDFFVSEAMLTGESFPTAKRTAIFHHPIERINASDDLVENGHTAEVWREPVGNHLNGAADACQRVLDFMRDHGSHLAEVHQRSLFPELRLHLHWSTEVVENPGKLPLAADHDLTNRQVNGKRGAVLAKSLDFAADPEIFARPVAR